MRSHISTVYKTPTHQSCQVPKLLSGQYIERGSVNFTKTSMQRSAQQSIEMKIIFLALSFCHYCIIMNFFRKYSSVPFLPLLVQIGQNSATNSSVQLFFSPDPFELFGRNFGHLATLPPTPTSGKGERCKIADNATESSSRSFFQRALQWLLWPYIFFDVDHCFPL